MNRYQGFSSVTGGLLVLDSQTGQVTLVEVGAAPIVLYIPTAETGMVSLGAHPSLPLTPIPMPMPQIPTSPGSGRRAPRAAEPVLEAEVLPILPIDQSALTPLDREIIATYPYPVARPWLDFLGETDPRERCRLLVDSCFTNVLKMWALQIASEYFLAETVRDQGVNQTLVRDLARPLISAWNLMIQRTLPVLKAGGIPLFSPELAEAYETLETRCKDKVIFQVRSEDEEGNIKLKKTMLGKIQAMIKYRNTLAHGFKLAPAKAESDLATYLPVMRDILEASRFMARYSLNYVGDREADGSVLCHRLMGATPATRPSPLAHLDFDPKVSPLFLRNDATGTVLPLFTFFDVEKSEEGEGIIPGLGGDVFLFEGNTNSSVIYISPSSGQQHEKQRRMRHWRDLLRSKEMDVVALSADTMSYEALRAAAARGSKMALERLILGGKYLREASLPRPDFDDRLMQFESGDWRGLLVGGESGIGKTTLFCCLVEQWIQAGEIVLFYRAAGLRDHDLASIVLHDLGMHELYFERFLQAVNDLVQEAGGIRFRIVLDAINEFPGDVVALSRSVDALVSQAADYPWVRVLASIRTSGWERLPRDSRPGSTDGARWLTVEQAQGTGTILSPLVVLQPLPPERIGELYERYRTFRLRDPTDPEDEGFFLFRPSTAFGDLDATRSTCAIMRSPLMMRLIMTAFNRRVLPSDLSYDQAMSLYLDHVVVEKENKDGSFPRRLKLLKDLVRELDRVGSDSIPRDELYAVPSLQEALKAVQRDSPYVQLLDLGVLLEEWQGHTCLVRFAFDRLFEHLLAEYHNPRVDTAEKALALAGRASTFRNLKGALAGILLRACGDGQIALVADLSDLCDDSPESERTSADIAKEIICELVEQLGRNRNPAFDELLRVFRLEPGKTDARILVEVSGRLLHGGEPAGAATAARSAVQEATAIGDPILHSEALLALAEVEDFLGDLRSSLDHLEEAGNLGGDGLAHYRIDLRRAGLLHLIGRGDEGLAIVETVAKDVHGHDDATEARALWMLSKALVNQRGEFQRPMELLDRALSLARKANQRWVESRILGTMGLLSDLDGRSVDARRSFAEGLAIAEGDGLPGNVAHVSIRFGEYLGKHGEPDQAESALKRALSIQERLGHRQGVGDAVFQLGALTRIRGDLPGAREMLERSLAIRHEIGDRSGEAESLGALAELAAQQGNSADARAIHQQVLELRRETSDTLGEADALRAYSVLLKSQNENDSAKETLGHALVLLEKQGNQRMTAETYNELGHLLSARGDVDLAIIHYLKAREIAGKIGWRSMLGRTANNLGNQHNTKGDLRRAESFYLEALAEKERSGALGGMVVNIHNLASLYFRMGRNSEAEVMRKRVLEIQTTLQDKAGQAGALASLAGFYSSRNRYTEAEESYQRSLALQQEIGAAAAIVESWRSLGHFLKARGRIKETEAAYLEALAVAEKLENRDIATYCKDDLATLAQLHGENAKALSLFEECRTYYQAKEQFDNVCLKSTSIAELLEKLGDFTKSEALLNEILKIKTDRKDRSGQSSALAQLAAFLSRRNRNVEAEERYNESIILCLEIGAPVGIINSRRVLGHFLRKMGRFDEAEKAYNEALAEASELEDKNQPMYCRSDLGSLAFARGNIREAIPFWEESLLHYQAVEQHWNVCSVSENIACALESLGDFTQARELRKEVLQIRERTQKKADQADALRALGDLAFRTGDEEEGASRFEAALGIQNEIATPGPIAVTEALWGEWLLRYDDQEGAVLRLSKALAIREKLGDVDALVPVIVQMARMHRWKGDSDEAARLLSEAIAASEKLENPVILLVTFRNRGICALLDGDTAIAINDFYKASELAIRIGKKDATCHLNSLMANAHFDKGDREEALADIIRMSEFATSSGIVKYQAMLTALRVREAAAAEDPQRISIALAEMDEAYKALPGRLDLEDGPAAALLNAAAFFHGIGDKARSAELAGRALALIGKQAWHRKAMALGFVNP